MIKEFLGVGMQLYFIKYLFIFFSSTNTTPVVICPDNYRCDNDDDISDLIADLWISMTFFAVEDDQRKFLLEFFCFEDVKLSQAVVQSKNNYKQSPVQSPMSRLHYTPETSLLKKKSIDLQDCQQLKSSNLSHFAGIFHAAQSLPGVCKILQPFSDINRPESLVVDIVANQGHAWVKVIARKGQALHLIWAERA
ncbi:hypothetical protein KUTeg_008463 [Tegillarca granosa]|uniref:DUF5614 domain-containing protein n=1 Tax=Tegillarca granosa TaxID=220873 RepID=A0ABQ9FDG0_TEGGR|nr:hypothetical protein KUTeg_008463 [Tegillarca granosa]